VEIGKKMGDKKLDEEEKKEVSERYTYII